MQLTAEVKKGEKYFVARCPELGVTTQGKTEQEAKENLKEAVELHLEAMVEYMIEHGKVRIEKGKIIEV
ncbi:MAG: type II toxin-antitoxin system HicB family antitoxin [Candidatus Aenigmarchaeota archaeon]|nr:type II toxin-antitoxin system HicB family antitoxin [Candidatus Aenigmarchaeota archaeon]MDI6722394.1 type II toxin-antitoxin system HicB family antitoxin [Candidatus Aenigmarchaeota archaeon]